MSNHEAVSKPSYCPECGALMDNLDYVGHSLTHYPEYLDPAKSSKEARKFQKLILAGGVTYSEYVDYHVEG